MQRRLSLPYQSYAGSMEFCFYDEQIKCSQLKFYAYILTWKITNVLQWNLNLKYCGVRNSDLA